MLWLRTWKSGIKSLLLHPMRSLLTILGIFIGVASVIWLVAIGEGISVKAQEQIEGLGADNVIVRSVKPPSEVTNDSTGTLFYGLTREDFELLEDTIQEIEKAVPIREVSRSFSYSSHVVHGRLVGCSPEYAELTQLTIEKGHFISDKEVKNKDNHCVLAAEVAEALFGFEDPIGQKIHIEEDYYTVVGVLKPREATAAIGGSLSGQEFNKDVYIPITTLWQRIGDLVTTRRAGSRERELIELNQATLKIKTISDNGKKLRNAIPEAADLIRLSLQHHDAMKDISIVVPYELLEQAKQTRMMFMVFMGLIAAISLMVGGIGIMNIMLATVTERTREIGIRRALGAKKRDIVNQFLIETIVLSVVGGITGVLGGLMCVPVVELARELVNLYDPKIMESMPDVVREVSPQIVPISIPIAFGISVAVGVIFGIYPAQRAASLDPIEALRSAN